MFVRSVNIVFEINSMSSKQARQGFQRVRVMWRWPQDTHRVTTGLATFRHGGDDGAGVTTMADKASMTFVVPSG